MKENNRNALLTDTAYGGGLFPLVFEDEVKCSHLIFLLNV